MSKRPRPVYFQHLQKTGGTSLVDTLRPFFLPERTADTERYLHECELAENVAAASQRFDFVAGHAEILSYAPPDAFKVSIFRDPLARLLSARRQVIEAAPENIATESTEMASAIVALRDRSIADLLSLVEDHIGLIAGFWNHQTLILGGWPILKAMGNDERRHRWGVRDHFGSGLEFKSWLINNKAKIVQRALRSLHALDYVGLTEDFDNSVREIFARMGLPEPGDVVVRNARPPVGNESDLRLSETAKEFIELDGELYEAAIERHAVFGRVARGTPVDYLSRTISTTTGLVVAANESPGGHGWYPCHKRTDGLWSRWTGPGCESRIAVRAPAGTYAMEITAYGAVSEAAVRNMIIEIEGRALPTEVVYAASGLWMVSAAFERACDDRFDVVLRFPDLDSEYGIELKQISFGPISDPDALPNNVAAPRPV